MSAWFIAIVAGGITALLQYGTTRTLSGGRRWLLGVLRALAVVGAVALLLNAPARRSRVPPPIVFVDASRSMTRADSTLWRAAWDSVSAVGADSVRRFGDSVGTGGSDAAPAANASRVQPVVERALAAGRPAVIVTDGEVQDSSALDGLIRGSRVIVLRRDARRDVAIQGLEAPRAAVQGDSLTLRVILVASELGAAAGTLTVQLDGRVLGRWPFDALSPWSERQMDVHVRADGSRDAAILRAVAASPGDAEARNDTLSVALELSRAATAVFASSSPDPDARFAMAVLRGVLALPTRGYLRVAPGRWRHEGSLSAATESDVREALREAPVAILHGDTAVFGPPQVLTRGPIALIVPPDSVDGEWYVSALPPSPLSGALAGVPLDSLPPIAAGFPASAAAVGDWVAVEARRGRENVRRPVVVGRDSPRRIVVVTGSGFWRWRFRGGASADAYAALWGGIFDWLAAERADRRGAVPEAGVLRAGDAVRWHRGSAADTTARVVLRRRGAPRADTLTLRFAAGVVTAETRPLEPGVYDAAVPHGRAAIVVNQPAELLPMRPRLRSGAIGRRAHVDPAGGVRRWGALYGLVILLFCIEWVLRRRAGLR